MKQYFPLLAPVRNYTWVSAGPSTLKLFTLMWHSKDTKCVGALLFLSNTIIEAQIVHQLKGHRFDPCSRRMRRHVCSVEGWLAPLTSAGKSCMCFAHSLHGSECKTETCQFFYVSADGIQTFITKILTTLNVKGCLFTQGIFTHVKYVASGRFNSLFNSRIHFKNSNISDLNEFINSPSEPETASWNIIPVIQNCELLLNHKLHVVTVIGFSANHNTVSETAIFNFII